MKLIIKRRIDVVCLSIGLVIVTSPFLSGLPPTSIYVVGLGWFGSVFAALHLGMSSRYRITEDSVEKLT